METGMEQRLARIEDKIDSLDAKITTALTSSEKARTAVDWLKYIMGGVWISLAYLFYGHK